MDAYGDVLFGNCKLTKSESAWLHIAPSPLRLFINESYHAYFLCVFLCTVDI